MTAMERLAKGNAFMTDCCTARAPVTLHLAHVGESRARNRRLFLVWLKYVFKGSRESERETKAGKGDKLDPFKSFTTW